MNTSVLKYDRNVYGWKKYTFDKCNYTYMVKDKEATLGSLDTMVTA